jgi:hypothetical protein
MTSRAATSPSFLTTVWLLLGIARRRASGRIARQRTLLRKRGGTASVSWSRLIAASFFVLAAMVNVLAASDLMITYEAAYRSQAAKEGVYVVDYWLISTVTGMQNKAKSVNWTNPAFQRQIQAEAARQAKIYGGDENAIASRLSGVFQGHGSLQYVGSFPTSAPSPLKGALPDLLALFVLVFWCGMLVCQGEGPDLDTQRQRHPMWEWLFSHPAPASAIFLAEMISPIAANPLYLTAPLFPATLYGYVYGWPFGVAAAALVGLPLVIALACLGKAIEINVLLRFSPRGRGAALALMGWFGYTSMMLLLIGMASLPRIVTAVGALFGPLVAPPWPRLTVLVGQHADGSIHFMSGVAVWWVIAGLATAGAVGSSALAARRGLAGPRGARIPARAIAADDRRYRFGREPLHRKELLWFRRDGSAITQVVLIPLSLAAFQLFNMRGLLSEAQGAWNYLCGAAILFGTYFLLILGPKSLASEGQALWIALTWPRGLESLLRPRRGSGRSSPRRSSRRSSVMRRISFPRVSGRSRSSDWAGSSLRVRSRKRP